MPEADPAGAGLDQPRLLGLGERLDRRAEQRLGELAGHRRRHDREPLQRLGALGAHLAQAREHGVLDARGHRVGRRGERLGDEERIAGGERVDGAGVAPGAGRQRVDGLAGERRELEPVDGLPGQRPEQPVQRMAGDQHLVAQRDDEQRAERPDPAGGVAEHVDGRVVGPMGVLDQQHRRPLLGELLHQRREDAVVRPVAGERLGQWTVGPDSGVM